MNEDLSLTKNNFDFIRLPIGYKISILIKGYLRHKKQQGEELKFVLKKILALSEEDCRNKKYTLPAPEKQSLHNEL